MSMTLPKPVNDGAFFFRYDPAIVDSSATENRLAVSLRSAGNGHRITFDAFNGRVSFDDGLNGPPVPFTFSAPHLFEVYHSGGLVTVHVDDIPLALASASYPNVEETANTITFRSTSDAIVRGVDCTGVSGVTYPGGTTDDFNWQCSIGCWILAASDGLIIDANHIAGARPLDATGSGTYEFAWRAGWDGSDQVQMSFQGPSAGSSVKYDREVGLVTITTPEGSSAGAAAIAPGWRTLKVEHTPTAIRAYVDGVLVAIRTTPAGSVPTGIEIVSSASPPDTISIDNFRFTPFV